MNSSSENFQPIDSDSPLGQLIRLLVEYRNWWLVPILVCTVAATFVALFTQKSYSSRQLLVVRDDLVGTFYKPGRFDSLESMKSAQETILEIARRPNVVRSALERLGPPGMQSASRWPGDSTIEHIQGKIQIGAPNGAEFGQTEAIVLSVQANSRERSREFIVLLLDEIEKSLREFRRSQFTSMETELAEAARIADESYLKVATELRKFEGKLGPDLGTLISLHDSQAGTNNLQSQLSTLVVEQRNARTDVEVAKKQIQILKDVAKNPENLLEVPPEMLQLLPTLDGLAKGLNDAVLKYSESAGRFKPPHPVVKSDLLAVETVKQQINEKLAASLVSLRYQVELRQDKLDRISQLINNKRDRLSELSEIRVPYMTLKVEVSKKAEINGNAQSSLSEIQSIGSAANEVDLITRVGKPQVDIYATGPSNKLIVFGGMAAGLFIGLGLVMLVAPVDQRIFSGLNSNGKTAKDNEATTSSNGLTAANRNQPLINPVSALKQVKELVKEVIAPVISVGATDTPEETTEKRNFQKISDLAAGKKIESEVTSIPIQPKPAPVSSEEERFLPAELPSAGGNGSGSISSPIGTAEVKVEDSLSSAAQAHFPTNNLPQTTTADSTSPTLDQFVSNLGLPPLEKPPVKPTVNQQVLEAAELSIGTNVVSIPDVDFDRTPGIPSRQENFNLSSDTTATMAEKVRQLEQGELSGLPADRSKKQPISTDVPVAEEINDLAQVLDASTGLPLTTSNQNSSHAKADGDESDPSSGDEPEIRPAATTVDLRNLKDQLAGRTASQSEPPRQKKLTEILSGNEVEDPAETNKLVVDKHIADLANSIRDMCKPFSDTSLKE